MRAILFPGLGSQYVGMCSDFYKKYNTVKNTFKKVDGALGFSLSNIIFNGSLKSLPLLLNSPNFE